MHLFTDPHDNELMAVLTDEDNDEMKTIIAAIREPHLEHFPRNWR